MEELKNYSEIIKRLKHEVEAARLHAALTVNKQMLIFILAYWQYNFRTTGKPGLGHQSN